MSYEQRDPPRKRESIKRFIVHCQGHPGVWFVYKDDYRGNWSRTSGDGGMEWRTSKNDDGTRVVFGRATP